MTRPAVRYLAPKLLAVTVLTGLAIPIGASEQQPKEGLGVKVKADVPTVGADAPVISLTIPPGGSASAFLVLENTSGAKIQGLKLLGYLVPAPGQTGTPPAITVKGAGTDLQEAGWTIEAGKGLPLTLNVPSFDPSAATEGWLVGTRGEAQYEALARVKIEKGGQVKLLNVGADGAVKIDLSINTLTWRLTAEATGSSPFDLVLVVTPFIGPNGVRVTPKLRVSGCAEVAPGKDGDVVRALNVNGPGRFYVDLETVEVVASGTYSGAVELRPAKEAPATALLTVTRTRSAPTVEMKPPDPIRDATHTWPYGAATEVRVYLKETGGRSVSLDRPELVSLTKKDGAGKVQAGARIASVLDADGEDVKQFPIELKPGEARLLRVSLSSLRDPGEYSGLLRFGSADYLALEQPVTIVKRYPALIAGLIIAVGIVGSFFQRAFFTRTLPRKQQVQDAAKLTLRVGEALRTLPPLTDAEQEAAGVLLNLFKQIHDAADGRQPTRDRLTLASKRLNLFLQDVPARAMVDSVRGVAVSDDIRNRLTAALNLVTSDAVTLDQIGPALTNLGSLPQALIREVRDGLVQQVNAFTSQVRVQRDDPNTTPVVTQALRDRVLGPLGQAAEGLPNKGRISELQKVWDAYDKARGTYAEVLSAELKRVLDGPKPPGMTDQRWTKLAWEDVGPGLDAALKVSATDPDEALAAYNRAVARYVLEVTAALLDAATPISQSLAQGSPSETPEEKRQRETEKTNLDTGVISVLQGIPAKVKAGNASEAADDYVNALGVYRKETGGVAGPGLVAVQDPTFLLAAAASGPAPGRRRCGPPRSTRPPRSPRSTAGSRAQWALLWVVLVLGTLSGLQTLWVVNPTWGSWADIAAVFVWGAGLQQIVGFTADQVIDAIDQAVK